MEEIYLQRDLMEGLLQRRKRRDDAMTFCQRRKETRRVEDKAAMCDWASGSFGDVNGICRGVHEVKHLVWTVCGTVQPEYRGSGLSTPSMFLCLTRHMSHDS